MLPRIATFATTALILLSCITPVYANPSRLVPAPDSEPVRHQFFRENGMLGHLVTVDLKNPRVKLGLALAQDRLNARESVRRMADRAGAIAAINASFFQIGRQTGPQPVGMVMVDGQVVFDSRHKRTSMGITNDNRIIIGKPQIKTLVVQDGWKNIPFTGINQPRKRNQTVLYTPHFGAYTHTNHWGREIVVKDGVVVRYSYGNTAIPDNGFVLSIHGASRNIVDRFPIGSRLEIETDKQGAWQDVDLLVTGAPQLVHEGRVYNTFASEKMNASIKRPAARSAVGYTHNGKLLLLTMNPAKGHKGMTLTQLAKTIRRLGAVEAMAFDGGGSSTLYLKGQVVNTASLMRPVVNALYVRLVPFMAR